MNWAGASDECLFKSDVVKKKPTYLLAICVILIQDIDAQEELWS